MERERKPYKMDDKIVSDLEDCLRNDFTVEEACRSVNIARDTYYRWIKESDTFALKMELAKDYVFTLSKKLLKKKIQEEGEVDVAKWVLERRRKQNYALRQEITGEEGEPVKVNIGGLFGDSIRKQDDAEKPETGRTT
jgi:hypothetical protein